MASLHCYIGPQPISLHSKDPRLIDLFLDYFRYYQPQPGSDSDQPAELALAFKLEEEWGARRLLAAHPVDLIAHAGTLSLWRTQTVGGDETLYLDCGTAFFTLHPAAGRATALLSERAFAQPQILANTHTLFALLLLLRARGLYHLHAAALVAPDERLWLICGAQRAGKTTLTTALGLSGWRPIADDSLLIGFDDEGEAQLAALKKYFHLDDGLLDRWPGLARAARGHSYLGRTCVDGLGLFNRGGLADQSFQRIDGVLLPQIVRDKPTRLEPISPSVALRQLAEQSTFLQLWPTETARQWRALTQLAAGARCFRFHSGADLLDHPTRATKLLAPHLAFAPTPGR